MSKRIPRYPHDAKVFVGNLGVYGNKQEIEDVFSAHGRVRCVWVARTPPGFAFVEFEDARDAAAAVRALDGSKICGCKARVELTTNKRGRGGHRSGDRGRDGSRDFRSGRRDGERRRPTSPTSRSRRYRSRSGSRNHVRESRSYDRGGYGYRERDRRDRSRTPRRTNGSGAHPVRNSPRRTTL